MTTGGVNADIDRLLAQIEPLAEKLALVLWQFPPQYAFTPASWQNLTRFCLYLSSLGQRCAFEFRDASWLNNDVAGLLQATGFGYVTADYPDFYLRRHVPRTGPFYYLRLHGRSGDYASSYSKAQLQAIAKAIAAYRADETCEDCFIMFNNDYGGNAVHNARTLLALCNT